MNKKSKPENKKSADKKEKLSSKNKKSKHTTYMILIIKIAIIVFIVFGFYYTQQSFENDISLLAVTEDSNGNPQGGSVVELNLQIKPGDGQIYTNLNTIEEVDTQISIINSQKIACDLFDLDCENYDFFYNFKGSALILKGPSASSAIAILTAKTMKREQIRNNIVITGSLNSGGIIGNVGGVKKKIEIAEELGFDKVIIPVFSEYNGSARRDIEVIKTIDIIDAYNNFNGIREYELETQPIDKEEYLELMSNIGEQMCARTLDLREEVEFGEIEENSSLEQYREVAQQSYNSSLSAQQNENYYSQGSFCYNANLNYRTIIEKQKNLTIEQREEEIVKLKRELEQKYVELNTREYRSNIETINDLYVYLLLMDRINEAREYIEDAQTLSLEEAPSNASQNQSVNLTKSDSEVLDLREQNIKEQKDSLYSFALERYYTLGLWEETISHTGERVIFNEATIDEACIKINKEISIKSQLLNNYGLGFFNEEIKEQLASSSPFSNDYLCVYEGLELSARINTVLNSVGIEEDNQLNYTKKILDITNDRIGINSKGDFPLIPYIYLEYANDLFEQEDYQSSMLYANYALTYTDLNLYLEKERVGRPYLNAVISEMFDGSFKSVLFIGSLLIIAVFLS